MIKKKVGKIERKKPKRGKVAIVGNINLYLHLRSKISSKNPKKSMKQMERRDVLKTISYELEL